MTKWFNSIEEYLDYCIQWTKDNPKEFESLKLNLSANMALEAAADEYKSKFESIYHLQPILKESDLNGK